VNPMCLIPLLIWTLFLSNFKPLRLSAPATKDLQSIADYTLHEWGAEQKKRYLDLIKQSFQTLSMAGNIGKKRDELAAGLYSYTIKKHCVYFRELEQEYVVVRILHSQMEPNKHL
jgi:toxin ParE1/3/4